MTPLPRSLHCLIAAIILLAATPLHRAAGQAEVLSEQAQDQFNAGNYEAAAELFEQLIRDYPTSALRSDAEMRAGYSLFLTGEYDRAIELLSGVLEPPAPAGVQEVAHSIIPQAFSAKAAGMAAEDPEREKTFLQAVERFGIYLEKFGDKEEAETALYGRAIAHYNLDKLDEAAADLRTNLSRFADSRSILDSQYFLALVLATQGNRMLAEDAAANRDAAETLHNESSRLLQGIIDKGTDVALANDATFQLAELNFNRGIFLEGDEQRSRFQEAISFYRKVQPKPPMVAAQQAMIESLSAQRREIVQRRDAAALRRLQTLIDRETTKLELLREKSDQTIESKIRVAQVYFQLEDMDSSRVLVRYLKPFLEEESQTRTAAYLLAMSYALQNRTDEAVAAHEAFNAEFKGAEIADNLALVLGTMFTTLGDFDAAVPYLAEQMELYPGGRFYDMAAMQLATAQAALGSTDEALATFREYLENNPEGPAEVRVQAEMGIATILKDTMQLEEAIAAYQKVRSEFEDMQSQVAMATFWLGYIKLQAGDPAGSIAELQTFIEKFPEHEMLSIAMFTLAQALESGGDSEGALATFTEVSTKFEGSDVATFAYFQRAVILAAQQKTDEVISVLGEFVGKYPGDDKIFAAVDTIGQNHISLGNVTAAIDAYTAFAENYPDHENAPLALLNVSNLLRQRANALGRYTALNEEQRAAWQADIDLGIRMAERVLEDYPDSEVVALSLASLLETQRLLLSFRLKDPPQVRLYFESFAERFENNPSTKSKVLFTLAAYVHEDDQKEALEIMKSAFQPELRYAPVDLDLFGLALLATGETDAAEAVFEKVAADFPNPPGVEPSQAPIEIQTAQSIATFGRGRIAQTRGQVAEAAALFDSLKTLYPWSPKVIEADYGIAQAKVEAGELDEAMGLLVQIIRARTAPAELRGNAMLLGGDIQAKKGDIEAAIDYYIKIATFYEGVARAASEGLWRGAQLIEQQIQGVTDPALRQRQTRLAARSYEDLINKYPNSPHVEAAKARLAVLQPASE